MEIEGVDKLEKSYRQQQQPYVYDPSQPQHVKYKLEEMMLRTIRFLRRQEWKLVVKLHTMVRLFAVLRGRQLEKTWGNFGQQLFNFAARKDQLVLLSNLSSD